MASKKKEELLQPEVQKRRHSPLRSPLTAPRG